MNRSQFTYDHQPPSKLHHLDRFSCLGSPQLQGNHTAPYCSEVLKMEPENKIEELNAVVSIIEINLMIKKNNKLLLHIKVYFTTPVFFYQLN